MDTEAQAELAATVAARRELGPEHEDALVESFLHKIEREIDRRVEEKVGRRQPARPPLTRHELGVAVPIVVVAGIFGGHVAVLLALVAIAVVFLALTLSRR